MQWSSAIFCLVLSQSGASALRRHAGRAQAKVRALQAEDSCADIGCGEFQWGASCQCDDQCEQYDNCCADYSELCGAGDASCAVIGCGTWYNSELPCQCNSLCSQYGNCCDDHEDLCEGGAPSPSPTPPGPSPTPPTPTSPTPPTPMPPTPPSGGSGDSAYCSGGSGSTVCPREGNNDLSAGGGGSCSFNYTYHTGTGQDTGAAVVSGGSCTVTSADLGAGSSTNQRVRDWIRGLAAHDGFEQDDAGHILANNLGGCGTCPVNLFPQSLGINRGAYRVLESDIADCISGGATAELSWSFQYKSPSVEHLRPESYTYTATFRGGSCASMSQTFENPQWEPSAFGDEPPMSDSE